MSDRVWCPDCEESHLSFDDDGIGTCPDCDTQMVAEFPLSVRVKQRTAEAVGLGIIGAVVFVPPAWAVTQFLSDKPLLAERTVERTVHYGVLPSIAPVLLLWVLVLFLGYAIPRMPRM